MDGEINAGFQNTLQRKSQMEGAGLFETPD